MDNIPYVYVEFHDGSYMKLAKADEAAATTTAHRYNSDPQVATAYVMFDLPGRGDFGDRKLRPLQPVTTQTNVSAEEAKAAARRMADFFVDSAMRPTLQTEFEQIPDSTKGILDHIEDASVHAANGYRWLRDPHHWPRIWRRLAMCFFPFAIVVWIAAMTFLLASSLILDWIVRICMWFDMTFISFDEYWNTDPKQKPYVLDVHGDRLDSATITGVRKK